MSEQEALEIIKKENLKVNWFGNHLQREYEMVIKKNDDEKYEVYATGEKAGIWGISGIFDSKEEALDDLIYRARL